MDGKFGNKISWIIKTDCSLSLLSSLVFLFFLHCLLVGGALRDTTSHVSVDLCVSLRSLQVDALLLGDLLETRALPFGEPSLWVWLGTRVFRVEVLGVLDCSLSLARGQEDFGTTLCLLDNIAGLLFLALLWHALINEFLHVFIVSVLQSYLGLRKILLDFDCLLKVATVDQETEVPTLHLRIVSAMSFENLGNEREGFFRVGE